MQKKRLYILLGVVFSLCSSYVYFDLRQPSARLRPQTVSSDDEPKSVVRENPVTETLPTPTPLASFSSPAPLLEPQLEADYQSARELAREGKFREASEMLHDLFSESPELIDRTLGDQAFRKYREHDDFRKLLNIMGRDIYQDLGRGPIDLQFKE